MVFWGMLIFAALILFSIIRTRGFFCDQTNFTLCHLGRDESNPSAGTGRFNLLLSDPIKILDHFKIR